MSKTLEEILLHFEAKATGAKFRSDLTDVGMVKELQKFRTEAKEAINQLLIEAKEAINTLGGATIHDAWCRVKGEQFRECLQCLKVKTVSELQLTLKPTTEKEE